MIAPRRLQLRRGNTAATSTYVGAAGELVVNTTTNTLYLHDGSTVGGYATTTNTSAINNQISSVNANITLANTGMQGYVNLANTIQSAQISAANIGIRGYVDATIAANIANIAVASTYSNVNVKAYTESMGYQNFGNVNVAAYVTTANSAIIGYIDLANTIQSAQVGAANLAITAANLGMKGYVDSVASQSIYGNGNVKSYLMQFNGSIIPSANVTYDLGDNTHRWRDLYLSGNTITLGDATISAVDGKLVTTGAAISPPTGAVGFANVQLEETTDFGQIRSYYVDNNFGYTANLKNYASAPIVWDELRSAKLKENSQIVSGYTPDFSALDTSGGRFANAVATLDATGNIASLAITDGGIGYDSYYPYYATDPTGYDNNYIGQSYTGSPTGKSFRRIGLIPTTATNVGNITSISGFSRYSGLPTVGTNTYHWIGNTGSNVSITINWASNTVTSYTYIPALPALTSANDWQNWLLDYQATNNYGWIVGSGSITGGGGSTIQAVYDYLNREALPNSLTYDLSNNTWYPGNLLVNNSSTIATLSSQTFFVTFNRTAIGYATVENSYGNPVYWLRGLTADSGISTGGDMTVAGDLRVAGDLYVSPTSIYMGNLRISAADGNLTVNTGVKFSDGSVQSSAYSNVKVATYLPTYSGNIAANISKAGYTWTFGTGGTTQFPNSLILAPVSQSITMQSDQYSQLMWENANLTVAPNMAINSNFYVAQNNATLDIGYRDGSSTQLIKSWYWSVDGNLKLPSGGYILNSDDSIYGAGSSYSNVEVATYLPTYSGNVANIRLGTSGVLTFADGTTQITAGGGSYSNVQVATYLPTYAGTVSASLVNSSGNILSSGLSVFGNTRIGLAGAVSGQFHIVVGNITQTSSGGAVYINTTGNVLAAAVVAGAVTSTGTVAVNAATGITTNQATFLFANASATTINMGGAATTIRMGTITSNVFVGSAIGNSNKELTLRAQGTWNIATSIDSSGGFNSPPYANQLVIGGSGTGMTANYSATGGYLTTVTIYNRGTGYQNGDVLSVPGGIAGNSFTLTNYSSTLTGNSAAAYTFGIEGNLTVPGNVTARNFIGGGALLTTLPGYAYSNVNVAAYLSTATINTTGNITAQNLIGNISITGNVTGTSANVTLQAGSYSSIFDNQGNVTVPKLFTAGNIQTAGYLFGNGTLLTGVAIKTTGSWTVPTGNSTQSFTVASGTYQLWVDCNIPNGILAWNATATVTNSNVPVVGQQFAWVYNGGGTPIDFTSIPNQFVGTGNTIVRSSVSPSVTTNRFDFGINNTSGGNVTVSYGYVKIS